MSASASAHPLVPLSLAAFPLHYWSGAPGGVRSWPSHLFGGGSAEVKRLEQRPRLQVVGLVGFFLRLFSTADGRGAPAGGPFDSELFCSSHSFTFDLSSGKITR